MIVHSQFCVKTPECIDDSEIQKFIVPIGGLDALKNRNSDLLNKFIEYNSVLKDLGVQIKYSVRDLYNNANTISAYCCVMQCYKGLQRE